MYKKQFADAIRTTKKLGLEIDSIDLSNKPLEHEERTQIYSIIQSKFGQYSADDVSQQCFGFTLLLKDELEKCLDQQFHYTLGYIVMEGKKRFYSDLASLKGHMGEKNRGVSQEINLHAWLTTSGGEIIDATLLTTLGAVLQQPTLIGGVIASYNESLKNLSYHPQIVGDKYLRDCGFIADFEFWEIS